MEIEARRIPQVPGARNFRDLGGYATRDGRRVRWGKLFRSGSLTGVTGEGIDALRALGIRGLCDLRTTRERQGEPSGWHGALGLSYWARDYETSFGELRTLMEAEMASGADARAAMLAGYRRMPFEQAPAYRELFRRLAADELPLIFNCSAGKDRTGIGAALVLAALGVSRATIVADYALTDRIADLEAVMARAAPPGSLLARQPPEVVRAILGCDSTYIAAALDTVAPSGEAFEAYLHETLQVTPDALSAIHRNLLD